jgi:putative ubiquitin-RnfH superfamily antitoxin RatB of RatAB toxin-antitoxin module
MLLANERSMSMANAELMVEIVYGESEINVFRQMVNVPAKSTIEMVLAQSDLNLHLPHLDWRSMPVGIFSKKKTLQDVVHDGDRIELYLPLQADAKQLRKARK